MRPDLLTKELQSGEQLTGEFRLVIRPDFVNVSTDDRSDLIACIVGREVPERPIFRQRGLFPAS